MSTLLRARWVLPDAFHCLEDAGILVRAGRIEAVASDARAVDEIAAREGIETTDLGDCVLAPGLVNAHAHLELSSLTESPSCRGSFVDWVGDVLRSHASRSALEFERAVDSGAARMLATGTTAVGDIDSTGAAARRLEHSPLRARIYREFLDGHSVSRSADEIARLEAFEFGAGHLLNGISPHAPHTVSRELMQACARVAHEYSLPMSVHWAETEEERAWLQNGEGPFGALLGESPRSSGLEQLECAGVLDRRVSLVHANVPEAGELRRVAERRGVLVHCPGTHRFFDREPVNLGDWFASGATIALGTDSLASNDDLDLRLEMARVRAEQPALSANVVLDWATRGGAVALGLEDEIGELSVGKSADAVAFRVPGASAGLEVVDALTASRPPVAGVWIAGELV